MNLTSMKSGEHPFLSHCQDMSLFCKPLNTIGIDYLSYTRVYKNGGRIYLSSKTKVLEEHFSRRHYLRCGNEQYPDNYQSRQIIVWSTLPNQSLYQDAKLMGACHGIYLFGDKNDDYCDSFGFASSKDDNAVLNSYFNNIDLLHQFVKYFHSELGYLIQQAERNKIILPFNNDKPSITYHTDELDQLFSKDIKHIIQLTNRQKECAYFVMQGMSAKLIAKELNLSPRTVEFYIDNLKSRLECKNKSELIIKLVHLFGIGSNEIK